MPSDFRSVGDRLDEDARRRLTRLLDAHGDVKVAQWLDVSRNTLWRAAAGGTLKPVKALKIVEEMNKLARVARTG